ncbi:MAG: hypothetical protein LBH49_01480 [Puniceicoccales bacterium]|jgi:hypothetical protein|nr:hypothetical protein [Puniceicoccales bacterium]
MNNYCKFYKEKVSTDSFEYVAERNRKNIDAKCEGGTQSSGENPSLENEEISLKLDILELRMRYCMNDLKGIEEKLNSISSNTIKGQDEFKAMKVEIDHCLDILKTFCDEIISKRSDGVYNEEIYGKDVYKAAIYTEWHCGEYFNVKMENVDKLFDQ